MYNASIVSLATHNTANEWGILKGSLSVVFLILFSYQWLLADEPKLYLHDE